MPFVKSDGNITESGQEDELNSEKCGTGGHSGKTFRNLFLGEGLWGRLKQSRLVAMVF